MQVCHFWAFQPQPASQVWEGVNSESVRRREGGKNTVVNVKVGRYGIILMSKCNIQGEPR